ncbi:50S ribosomal protein L25/general stress protein Ctc [Rhodoligotrophos defluvii]|uniref:50S ribosomal protein L25/general stress protein Ctc n=1 Tax=Rhodoligotrophos defluvii TaxID=2561934 RepID=UPI0010CA07F5|nr:50S ribosomal protein L25/general stress protein Ctc [Rhodoligotrophos defluvii]
MAQTHALTAVVRDRAGKGAARAVRRQGRVPGVIYGAKQEPQLISLAYKDLMKEVETGRFLSTIYTLDVNGDKVQVLPRDVQFEPVRDFLIHVDFLRVAKDSHITVAVPVVFANEERSPGIKRGGVLNIVRHEIELDCPADNIPEEITIDLTGTDIGDSIHISAVKLPEGVKPTITDRDFTIATIATPAAGVEEAAEEGAEGEGETPAA